MFDIAVRCKNTKDVSTGFLEIARRIKEDPTMNLHWLVYDKDIVGNSECRVRFFSITNSNNWIGNKFDVAMGFDMWEQKEILKEGRRASRRFIKLEKNYIDEVWKYFKMNS